MIRASGQLSISFAPLPRKFFKIPSISGATLESSHNRLRRPQPNRTRADAMLAVTENSDAAVEGGSTMRKAIALLLGTLLPVLGLAGISLAQSSVQVQGTIQAVDCQSQTIVLNDASGSNTVAATGSTAVVVNSTSVPFCTLQQYVGASATAWLVPGGNEFQLSRIDVVGPATSASQPLPAPAVSSPSTLGIIVGALAVGALGYIIGRNIASQPAYQPAYVPGYNQPAYQYNQSGWSSHQGSRYYQQCGPRANQLCSNRAPGSQR
jgi:hypothetical protein